MRKVIVVFIALMFVACAPIEDPIFTRLDRAEKKLEKLDSRTTAVEKKTESNFTSMGNVAQGVNQVNAKTIYYDFILRELSENSSISDDLIRAHEQWQEFSDTVTQQSRMINSQNEKIAALEAKIAAMSEPKTEEEKSE